MCLKAGMLFWPTIEALKLMLCCAIKYYPYVTGFLQNSLRATMGEGEGKDIFKKGVAISTWQCSPDPGLSNWSRW